MWRPRILFNISMLLSVLALFFYVFSLMDSDKVKVKRYEPRMKALERKEKPIRVDDYNLWLIFTKVIDKSPLMYSFNNLVRNLLNVSSVELHFNVIVDGKSRDIAEQEFERIADTTGRVVQRTFYNVSVFAEGIADIVSVMTPFFSSRPGTYYSDASFYLSLGLYRLAPEDQKTAIMLDCDVHFKEDILGLFRQFEGFESHHLFGLSPELSPVYRHILYTYKQKHNTTFGEHYGSTSLTAGVHPRGFQGYNSGVILFNFTAIRDSDEYKEVIKKEGVERMVKKYSFRGHLGDQDFYTLLGFEYPHMIKTLNCGFNRQLCTWWRDKGGYKDIFDDYFRCKHKAVVLHGNCNTKSTGYENGAGNIV